MRKIKFVGWVLDSLSFNSKMQFRMEDTETNVINLLTIEETESYDNFMKGIDDKLMLCGQLPMKNDEIEYVKNHLTVTLPEKETSISELIELSGIN